MGIYYTLYNLTRAERISGYWKSDPFCNADAIARLRGWAADDIIVSTPDTPGDIYRIVCKDGEWDLVTLDGMDFYHDVRTEENALVLDAWPEKFTQLKFDGVIVVPEEEVQTQGEDSTEQDN